MQPFLDRQDSQRIGPKYPRSRLGLAPEEKKNFNDSSTYRTLSLPRALLSVQPPKFEEYDMQPLLSNMQFELIVERLQKL